MIVAKFSTTLKRHLALKEQSWSLNRESNVCTEDGTKSPKQRVVTPAATAAAKLPKTPLSAAVIQKNERCMLLRAIGVA